jgi:hypothetical protein
VTEADWLASQDPWRLMLAARAFSRTEGTATRKLRLLGCAYCRRRWGRLRGPERHAVEAAERLADQQASQEEFLDALREQLGPNTSTGSFTWLLWSLGGGPDHTMVEAVDYWDRDGERAAHARLGRDIFGNPYRSVTIDPGWLAWNGGTVPKLARTVYDDWAFDRLPILADALEDAGCSDPEVLAHCRQPGEHARGCWAVDLLLGKE